MSFILSLDSTSRDQIDRVINATQDKLSYIKIGHIPYGHLVNEYKEILKENKAYKLFFDFKLHDIPNTVESAIRNYKKLYSNLELMTIWGVGSDKMIKSALNAHEDVKALSVISLTSDNMDEDNFMRLVDRNLNLGVRDFICPPTITKKVKAKFKHDIKLYSPGIRIDIANNNDDQQHISTPKNAILNGSDYIIMGRSILNAKDPKDVLKDIRKYTS